MSHEPRAYCNCGTASLEIDGVSYPPGTEFTAVLTPDHEAFLKRIEAIREVKVTAAPKPAGPENRRVRSGGPGGALPVNGGGDE